MSTSDESLKETGRGAAAAIVQMVAALECDYGRLEELRTAQDLFGKLDPEATYSIQPEALTADEAQELAELVEAAGECTSREDAETRIRKDALDIRMRGDWFGFGTEPADAAKPVEAYILLSTGGPASRIMLELDYGEPSRAWLEVQDWGTPWTRYFDINQDTLLAYARCFYFGEG